MDCLDVEGGSTMELFPRFFITFLLVCVSLPCAAGRLAPPLSEQARTTVNTATGAEVLQSRVIVEVDSDLSWQATEYFSIRINDLQSARDYGRIQISYNHFYSELELEFANVLSPQGELKSVKPDALQERSGGGQDFYEDKTSLAFSLPDIAPNAIIEFQVRRKSKKVVMPGLFADTVSPYWYQPTIGGNGGRLDPVRFSEHRLIYPAERQLYRQAVGPLQSQFTSSLDGDYRVDQWRWENIPSVPIERAQQPIDELLSRVKVSTLTDWSEVGLWSWGLFKDKVSGQEKVASITRSLAVKQGSREEKIRAVYEYLQSNVRYVFAHLGRGGYEPHAADEVLQQGYGDCKDQTVLAVALLRELGVDAFPALVVTPRNSRPDTHVVSLMFDHMITFIPGNNEYSDVWMDTTPDRALFPGLSSYLINQHALVVDGQGDAELTVLGLEDLPENQALLDMDYFLDEVGHVRVKATAALSGIYEQNFRSWWIHDNNRETTLDQMMGNLFPDAKTVKLDTRILNDQSLWDPIAVEVDFDFGKLPEEEEGATYGVGISQVYRLFGSFNSLQIPRERKSRWVNEFSESMAIHAEFRGSELDVPVVMTSGINVETPFFTIEQSGRQTGKGIYEVDMMFAQPPLNLSLSEYGNYYQALREISEAGHWVVKLVEEKTAAERKALAEMDENSIEALLSSVRHHLDNGEFEQALTPALTAVERYNGNGEAWYLLGLAQGYNALVGESQKSFARAADLGYQP